MLYNAKRTQKMLNGKLLVRPFTGTMYLLGTQVSENCFLVGLSLSPKLDNKKANVFHRRLSCECIAL